jgi:hypothetical protein
MGTEERYNPQKVQVPPFPFGPRHGPEEGFILEKGTILNRPVNPEAVGIYPSPGTDMQMTNL